MLGNDLVYERRKPFVVPPIGLQCFLEELVQDISVQLGLTSIAGCFDAILQHSSPEAAEGVSDRGS